MVQGDPINDTDAAAKELAAAWLRMASVAPDIAHARRTLYLAYVSEGFSEYQALELVKAP